MFCKRNVCSSDINISCTRAPFSDMFWNEIFRKITLGRIIRSAWLLSDGNPGTFKNVSISRSYLSILAEILCQCFVVNVPVANSNNLFSIFRRRRINILASILYRPSSKRLASSRIRLSRWYAYP